MEYGFQNFMVPRKGLEPLHLAATASKTVMSTIPSPGQICLDLQLFVMYSSRMSSRFAETRTPRVLLHFVQGVLGSMAPYGRTPRVLPFFASLRKGRTSTIPSPGQICLVLEMGLEPTHPKAYASETYVSTIPPPEHIQQTFTCCTCTPSHVSHRFTDARIPEYGSRIFAKRSFRTAHLPFHHPSEQRQYRKK